MRDSTGYKGIAGHMRIVDFLQRREPLCNDTCVIFLAAANRCFEGFITAKSLTDFYYLTRRFIHDDRKAYKGLSTLLIPLDLLNTAGIDCRKANSSDVSDYEDAVMVETATRTGIDAIVTRNARDYAKSTVPMSTPTELLAMLEANKKEIKPLRRKAFWKIGVLTTYSTKPRF